MSEAAEPAARPGVFTLTIRSKAALYAAWMPLLRGGGIFLPSNRSEMLIASPSDDVTLLEGQNAATDACRSERTAPR